MDAITLFSHLENLLHQFVDSSSKTLDQLNSLGGVSGTICFFPGTFTPWHDGHSYCVTKHLSSFPDIPLMVLPDINPQKNPIQTQKELITLPKNPQVRLSWVFQKLTKSNPTFRWITFLKTQNPNLKLGLLIGLDSFMNLPTWINYQDLLLHLDFLEVIERDFTALDTTFDTQKTIYQRINPALKIHYTHENPYKDLSSTKLRQKRVQKS
jgi:nicotinate-nucleotide adenylyltransferase